MIFSSCHFSSILKRFGRVLGGFGEGFGRVWKGFGSVLGEIFVWNLDSKIIFGSWDVQNVFGPFVLSFGLMFFNVWG